MSSPKAEERLTVSVRACASAHPRHPEALKGLPPMQPHVRGDLQFCFSRRMFPADKFVKNNFERGIVGELGVWHKRWRQLLGWLGGDRIYLRPLLRHRRGWEQPQAECPFGLSLELVEVNGEMTQSCRHALVAGSGGFPPSSLVPSVFPPDVEKYRELDERR